jgi:tetratricopeptide (TPR) repeat protein
MLSLTPIDSLHQPRSSSSLDQQEQLRLATEFIDAGYNLVWKLKKYDEAIEILKQALQIQLGCLGKHHKDVGYTCNFIGTAHWLKEELRPAMKYFLEARRIFCKSGRGKVKGIDQRIHCILEQLGLKQAEISYYQGAIQRTIEHELQGDRLKQKGFIDQAKLEYLKARRMSASLNNLL